MNNREKIEKLLKLQKSYGDKFSNYLIEEEDENSRDEKRAYRKGYIEGCLNTFLDIFDIIPFSIIFSLSLILIMIQGVVFAFVCRKILTLRLCLLYFFR